MATPRFLPCWRRAHRCVAGTDTPTHLYAPSHDLNATGTRPQHQRDQHPSHHRHRRPPPAQSFTSYPPSRRADLSRTAARQPSCPGLPIPQLFPPCRGHRPHLRPVLLSSRHARFQSEPPWGHSRYVKYSLYRWWRLHLLRASRHALAPTENRLCVSSSQHDQYNSTPMTPSCAGGRSSIFRTT